MRRPIEITRLSSKGQVVVPKAIREARNWQPGTEFAIVEAKDGVLLRPTRLFAPTALKDVAGCLAYRGKAKTVRQMDRAIARNVKERHDRGRY